MAVGRDWLIDKSALARVRKPNVAEVLTPRIGAGRVGICSVTELEVGFSARSTSDHDDILRLLARLVPVPMPVAAERIARDTQRQLIERDEHRAVAIPDLFVASIASVAGLTVLHYDGNFDLIASVTAQPTEWVVPAGAGD